MAGGVKNHFVPIRNGVLLGKTLKFRQSQGRTGRSKERLGRHCGEKNLRFLKKGKRGMTAKPIGSFPMVSKTPKGSKAQERMIKDTRGI
jgi:hypothetical protein